MPKIVLGLGLKFNPKKGMHAQTKTEENEMRKFEKPEKVLESTEFRIRKKEEE